MRLGAGEPFSFEDLIPFRWDEKTILIPTLRTQNLTWDKKKKGEKNWGFGQGYTGQ